MSRTIGFGRCHQDRIAVMSLLLVLSIPAISAVSLMVAGITVQTLHPRLQRAAVRTQARVLTFRRQ
jgi:hypothetical protein